MTDPAGPTDAELVTRVLAADRDAFAAVYDRYGPKLFDFAYSMLRHREDAADAVADAFVIFAERLHQLRDPERLRPWLYAIVRSECLRRLKGRKRIAFGDEEQLIAMADEAPTPEQEAETAALRQIVWDAAAGLADRDRALLDLHLRQGLDGAELGEAMGVSAANAYVMLNRLRAQVDRSLGALLIARTGRDDCDELDELLRGWDGTFSPLIRKRVARHVEGCEVCSARRRRMLSPWMLLASVPVFVAPLSLRDRVLADTRLVAAHLPGEPARPTSPARGRRTRTTIAAAAVLIVGGAVTTTLLQPESDTNPVTPAAPSSSSSVSPSPVPAPTPSSVASAPSSTPTVTPGSIVVGTSAISLGRSRSRASISISNPGDLPVTFAVSTGSRWLKVSPAQSSLGGSATSTISVRADRQQVAEGRSNGAVRIRWDGGSARVLVSLTQERDPKIGLPRTGTAPSCTPTVTAPVSDESGLTTVTLTWTGPGGSGRTPMSHTTGSTWTADAGPFGVGGTVTFRVVATDRRGNTGTGPATSVFVNPCPQ